MLLYVTLVIALVAPSCLGRPNNCFFFCDDQLKGIQQPVLPPQNQYTNLYPSQPQQFVPTQNHYTNLYPSQQQPSFGYGSYSLPQYSGNVELVEPHQSVVPTSGIGTGGYEASFSHMSASSMSASNGYVRYPGKTVVQEPIRLPPRPCVNQYVNPC